MLLVASAERLVAYNATAHRIWCTLADGGNAADAAAMLASSFAIDLGDARQQVDAIIGHWQRQGLLEREEPAASATTNDKTSLPVAPAEWGAQWTCRFGDRLVEFAVEDARRAAAFRLPFQRLETGPGRPDSRLEVRELGGDTVAILRDGHERARVSREEGLKEEVHQSLIDFLWPDWPVATLIHAGAVASGDAGFCFPAPSGSGKSTLIAHLLAVGFQYLADDLAPLDASGHIVPWPLPLSLKKGSWDVLGAIYPDLESSPSFAFKDTHVRFLVRHEAWAAKPTRLRALIFPGYRPSHAATLERIRPLAALIQLQEAGIWLGHPLTDVRVRRFLSWLESTPAYTLTYGRLADATALIEDLACAGDVTPVEGHQPAAARAGDGR